MKVKDLKKKIQIKYSIDFIVIDQINLAAFRTWFKYCKNLVDLHNATIKASNRTDQKGASMEIIFPKV